MTIGTSAVRPAGGPKKTVSWRHVSIGTSTPAVRASAPAQAPAASTTTREPMRPASVSTPATASPSTATAWTRRPRTNRAP